MKGIRIEKGSWHYWMATRFGWKEHRKIEKVLKDPDDGELYIKEVPVENDFCSYVRRVILGTFLTSCLVLVLSLLAIGVAMVEYEAVRSDILCWFFHECVKNDRAKTGNQVFLFLCAMALIVWLINYMPRHVEMLIKWRNSMLPTVEGARRAVAAEERRLEKKRMKLERLLARQNGETFLRSAYRSFKERVCFRMDIR
jgi:hypothetical protein